MMSPIPLRDPSLQELREKVERIDRDVLRTVTDLYKLAERMEGKIDKIGERLDKLENDADETGRQSLAEIKATAERRTHPTLLREDIDELDEKAARKSDVSELKGRVEKIETEKHGGDKAFRTLVIGALVSLTVSVSAAAILHAVFH